MLIVSSLSFSSFSYLLFVVCVLLSCGVSNTSERSYGKTSLMPGRRPVTLMSYSHPHMSCQRSNIQHLRRLASLAASLVSSMYLTYQPVLFQSLTLMRPVTLIPHLQSAYSRRPPELLTISMFNTAFPLVSKLSVNRSRMRLCYEQCALFKSWCNSSRDRTGHKFINYM